MALQITLPKAPFGSILFYNFQQEIKVAQTIDNRLKFMDGTTV